ncbi:MAG: zf-TFIIB domain-containing protein [Burkholderiales bacterium]|nr:zf-TFIIB domain-containing protein [Anaerolineae bacterium]
MNCPVCKVPLQMSDRQGIEIDYCPQCRGVWLDRGELDKIIERSAAYETRTTLNVPSASDVPRGDGRYEYYDDDDDSGYEKPKRHPQEKRKSFLGDMFDIFD